MVFAFLQSDSEYIYEIEDYQSFYAFIQKKKPIIKSLWNSFQKGDFRILEINFNEDINPIFMDINDFQFLMPPFMMLPPYTRESIQRIMLNIACGIIEPTELPSGVIQGHLPYIKKQDVVNVYPLFTFEDMS